MNKAIDLCDNELASKLSDRLYIYGSSHSFSYYSNHLGVLEVM